VSGSDVAARLPVLLSQALVAFTIEFDNEFERQMPHRTTNHLWKTGLQQGPWLVSMAMWWNCMRFVSEDGITVRKLEELARTPTNLNGMMRWGYIVVEPDPADRRPKPPHSDWVIRATLKGRKAQEVWRPLFDLIEKRWETRFGRDVIERLRTALWAVIRQIDVELPDCLPILKYGLFSREPDWERRPPAREEDRTDSSLALPALLSRVLLTFAIEFERELNLSLAISANLLRILDEKGVRIRDLPVLSGVSKEAISMAMGILQKKGLAVIEADTTGKRIKAARLTAKGIEAQREYYRLLVVIEERWNARFGEHAIRTLKELLQQLAGASAGEASRLFLGLTPYPDGWRASRRQANTLPRYPMVLHRGGYPDGS
jgi:DNA-binding MarR family transcriptional regulator